MKTQKQTLVVAGILGFVSILIWKFSGIPLSQEIPTDYSVMPHLVDLTNQEYIVSSVFAILFSIIFYYPFYQVKSYPLFRIGIASLVSILFLTYTISHIMLNAKGVLMANWFGEDYGFGVNLTKIFLACPIVYFAFNKLIFSEMPKRNLVYLFMLSFIVYGVAKLIAYLRVGGFINSGVNIVTPFRYIFSDGYFMMLYAVGLCWIGIESSGVKKA